MNFDVKYILHELDMMTAISQPEGEAFVEMVGMPYIKKNVPIYLRYSLVKRLRLVRKVPQLDVYEAKQLIDKGELVILDVRAPESYERGHIENSINIEGYLVKKNRHKLPKDKIIAVMCYGGGLSEAIAHRLRRWGFKNVVNLQGGIEQWAIEIDQSLLDGVW